MIVGTIICEARTSNVRFLSIRKLFVENCLYLHGYYRIIPFCEIKIWGLNLLVYLIHRKINYMIQVT